MSDTQYLRKRRGRWLVQVAVPKDLREHFGKANIESYLGTSSLPEAKKRRHKAVAEILASFDRTKQGGPLTAEELQSQAEIELRRAYDALAADFLDAHGRLPDLAREVGEDAVDLVSASFQTNRLLGKPTTEYAEDVLDRIGVAKTEESVAALSHTILKAHSAAVAMLQRGMEPPPMKGQPVRRKRHGTAPKVTIGATSTHDGTANDRVPGLLGPFDASHGWHGTFLEKNMSSGNIYEEGLGNMNARRSTDRGADHLKMRQLAQLTELRARRGGRCTLSAKASTYIDSIRTSTRAPTFLNQVGVPL